MSQLKRLISGMVAIGGMKNYLFDLKALPARFVVMSDAIHYLD